MNLKPVVLQTYDVDLKNLRYNLFIYTSITSSKSIINFTKNA